MPAGPITIDRKDPRFDALKRGNNIRFPATDAEAASRVVICSNADEIADALQRIVASGLRPTVRSGGHCYEDFVSNNPNGAIIDISLHHTIDADASGVLRVAAGCRLGDVYQTLYKRYGVVLPAGTCYMVGAGGHISGGGYGLLARLHGLTIDWVTAVDILTVDSKGKVIARHVTKKDDPDLLRACRGAGGGNFGIITNFYFDKLPVAPKDVVEASMTFPWASLTEEKFARLLAIYGDYWQNRGKEKDTWGLSVVMVVTAKHNASSHISIDAQFCNVDGSTEDLSVLHEFFHRFDELDPTWSTTAKPNPSESPTYNSYGMKRRPWLEALLAGGDSGGVVRAKYKSTYMKDLFVDAECKTMYKFLTSPEIDSHGFVLAIDGYGGATNITDRISDTAMAQRVSIMKLQWQCYWQDAAQDAGRVKFMDDFYTAVYTGPHVGAEYQGTPFGERYEGCYMNYCDVDMVRYSYWPELYYGTAGLYPFLQQVKKRYDPNNIFHNSMSVRA